MKQRLINPAGYIPVSVTDVAVDGSSLSVEKSDGTQTSMSLPSGGSGSDTDIVEVKDTVTSTNGGEQHVITATEGNGTENQVGTFVVATEQIVSAYPIVDTDTHFLSFYMTTVDQYGNSGAGQTTSPFGTYTHSTNVSFTLPDSFSGIVVYVLLQNPSLSMYIPVSISRTMLDRLGTEITFTGSHTYTPTEFTFSTSGIAVNADANSLSSWSAMKPYICTITINKTNANVVVQTESSFISDVQIAFI